MQDHPVVLYLKSDCARPQRLAGVESLQHIRTVRWPPVFGTRTSRPHAALGDLINFHVARRVVNKNEMFNVWSTRAFSGRDVRAPKTASA